MIINKTFNIKGQTSSLQLFTECDLHPAKIRNGVSHPYGVYTKWILDKNGAIQMKDWVPQYYPVILGMKYITYTTMQFPQYKPFLKLARQEAEKHFFTNENQLKLSALKRQIITKVQYCEWSEVIKLAQEALELSLKS